MLYLAQQRHEITNGCGVYDQEIHGNKSTCNIVVYGQKYNEQCCIRPTKARVTVIYDQQSHRITNSCDVYENKDTGTQLTVLYIYIHVTNKHNELHCVYCIRPIKTRDHDCVNNCVLNDQQSPKPKWLCCIRPTKTRCYIWLC